MLNTKALRAVMLLNDDTDETLAKALGISTRSANSKINERDTEFKQSEINAIIARYNLTETQIREIFFGN